MFEPKDNHDGTFTDSNNSIFSTPDAMTPSSWGVAVTIHENGQPSTGFWNGSTAEKTGF